MKTPKTDRGSSASRTVEVPLEKVFTPYVASIEKKKLRLINFMAAYKEDTTVFDKCKLTSLNTYIKSLRDQVSRMEASWDTMRNDRSLRLTAFTEIGALFQQMQTLAEETLDQADTFRNDRAKIAAEAEDVKEEEMADGPDNSPKCSPRPQQQNLNNEKREFQPRQLTESWHIVRL